MLIQLLIHISSVITLFIEVLVVILLVEVVLVVVLTGISLLELLSEKARDDLRVKMLHMALMRDKSS